MTSVSVNKGCLVRHHALWLMRLLLFCSLILSVSTFSSPSPNGNVLSGFLGGLEGPGYNFLPPPPLQPRAKKLLEELNIRSSTEPALAKVPASKILNLFSASVPTLVRGANGVFGLNYKLQWIPRDDTKYAYIATKKSQLEETCFARPPTEPIVLFDVESILNCRKVREACSILSLTVDIRPVPRGGRQFASEIKEYGASVAPCIFDPNTAVAVSDVDRIIGFLFTTYGSGNIPRALEEPTKIGPPGLSTLSSTLADGFALFNSDASSTFSNPPPRTIDGKPALTLYAYEGSPYCKIVRECLSRLELEHTIIYAPRGSPNRARLWEKVGRFQVPYLEDSHTGVALLESTAIVEYLKKQYSVSPSPVQFM